MSVRIYQHNSYGIYNVLLEKIAAYEKEQAAAQKTADPQAPKQTVINEGEKL